MLFKHLLKVPRLSFVVARQSLRAMPLNSPTMHRFLARTKVPRAQMASASRFRTMATRIPRPQAANMAFQTPDFVWSRTFSGFADSGFSLALLTASIYAFCQLIRHATEPREVPIIAKAIHSNESLCRADDIHNPEHGSLKTEVLAYQDKRFLKKGAANREKLIREFVIGDALHAMYPDTQPMTLLYHEAISNEDARYHTLSEIKPGVMDFADFIKAGNWQEKLAEKPLHGFERALAMVALMAGQQDCKFANLVIIEKKDHYEAAAIDFELSGERFFSINQRKATNQFDRLTAMIRDLHQVGDGQLGTEQAFELSNNPMGKAFVNYAKNHSMNHDSLNAFYCTAASHDYETTLEKLEALRQKTNLVSASDIASWRKEFKQWKSCAQRYCREHGIDRQSSLTC